MTTAMHRGCGQPERGRGVTVILLYNIIPKFNTDLYYLFRNSLRLLSHPSTLTVKNISSRRVRARVRTAARRSTRSYLVLFPETTSRAVRPGRRNSFLAMVLTDRQRKDLHSGIYEYLLSRPGEAFQRAAAALQEADPESCKGNSNLTNGNSGGGATSSKTPLLEKKWTAIPRLQKKVLELERVAAQSAKIHAHRLGTGAAAAGADGDGTAGGRRMLPRLPYAHKLQGHSLVVTSVTVHPVFTVTVSGSEDGTVKVRLVRFYDTARYRVFSSSLK